MGDQLVGQSSLEELFNRTIVGIGKEVGMDEISVPILERKDFSPAQHKGRAIESQGVVYTPQKHLGSGGMGEVWLADRICTARAGTEDDVRTKVAIKFVRGMDQDSRLSRALIKEAKFTANLQHDNIVEFQSWEYLPGSGTYFIVMDYVEGVDLYGLIGLHNLMPDAGTTPYEHLLKPNITKMNDDVAGFIVFSVANALEYAHEYVPEDENGHEGPERVGVIHRDISPGNILIRLREGSVKLSDFGIAMTATDIEGEGGIISGKIPYIAPEILYRRKVDARTDLYSLGVVLYEMLTGLRPNDNYTKTQGIGGMLTLLDQDLKRELVPPHEIVQGIDIIVSEVACKLLENDPDRRIQSASELIDAIGAEGIYKSGFGCTKSGLKHYAYLLQHPDNITEKAVRNLKFFKNDSFCKINMLMNPDEEPDLAEMIPHVIRSKYTLTNYARKKLENGENPARV
ncbi:serine/threonine protein kinase [Nanoarchaeota archaeon]